MKRRIKEKEQGERECCLGRRNKAATECRKKEKGREARKEKTEGIAH